MLDFLVRHKKATLISAIVAFILIISISVYFIIDDMAKSAKISILVSPLSATVRVDGTEYRSYGEFKIRPGEYEVEIFAEGFITKTGELTVVENETSEIKLYLEPAEGNENYYADHPVDATIVGDLKAAEALKKVELLKNDNPILESLPVAIDYYSDNYSKRVKYTLSYVLNNENSDFVITITDYTGGNREAGMSRLKNLGADLNKYTIEYSDVSAQYESGGHAF